jgi:3-dehydroquinate synthase
VSLRDVRDVESVTVTHALGSYPVYVAPDSLSRVGEMVGRHLASRRVVLIADEQVYHLLESHSVGSLNWTGDVLTFPAGEQSKTRDSWARLTDAMVQRRYGRDSGIIALGGGVTGDLAGFVAATYMRGVPYLQVPTTLLAMVDASVGGKTAVNTPAGKNLVGAFFPPAAVVADPVVLRTLPDSAFRGGLAEAVKHGLIADREYFEWMETQVDRLLARDVSTLTHLVRRSVEIKAQVVSADEREAGRRAILNAGHTVAHGLEQLSGYSLPHGDAVALGLIAECALAEQLGVADRGLCQRVTSLLGRLGLPIRSPEPLNGPHLISAMLGDKKNRDGVIHVALIAQLGRMHRDPTWTTAVSSTTINQAIEVIQ